MRTQNIVIFVKKCLVMQKSRKKYVIMIITQVNLGVPHIQYATQKDIPVFFHNGTNYDFHLIINELAKEFKSELHCIPLNGEKFMSFSIPIR